MGKQRSRARQTIELLLTSRSYKALLPIVSGCVKSVTTPAAATMITTHSWCAISASVASKTPECGDASTARLFSSAAVSARSKLQQAVACGPQSCGR
jgi:hypothetical protein